MDKRRTFSPENTILIALVIDELNCKARGGAEDEGEVLKLRDAHTVDTKTIKETQERRKFN